MCNHVTCARPPKENGYCGIHQRFFTLKDAEEKGIKYCRFFLRGCNTVIEPHEKTCTACLAKKFKDKTPCSHEGCLFHVCRDAKYCKKHERDVYRDEEKEKGIKYCDLARGCFNILTEAKSSCEMCLEGAREKERALFEKRKTLLKDTKGVKGLIDRICVDCGKAFEMRITTHSQESKRCLHCTDTMRHQDAKRAGRERVYKEEMLASIETYFRQYYTSAHERGYDFALTKDQFRELVIQPCYYCNASNPKEANGLDRINNDLGYTLENCKPCCGICNRMKSFYHPVFFVEKAKHIAAGTRPSTEFYTIWSTYYLRSNNHCYATYRRDALERRKMEFILTRDDWNALVLAPCYLCGYTSPKGIGIDRVDNTLRSYTRDNCQPCCGSCNSMKCTLAIGDVVDKCKQIDAKWADLAELHVIPLFTNPLKAESKDTSEVVATAPTKWQARTLYKAILTNTTAPFLEYNHHVLTAEDFTAFTETLKEDIESEEKTLPALQKFIYNLRMLRAKYKRTR